MLLAARGAGPGRPHPARRLAHFLLGRSRRQESDALFGRTDGRLVARLARRRPRQRQVRRRAPGLQLRAPEPANTYWTKLYNLYAKVDTEGPRFLDFERWWGGHFLLNREEMDWIVQNLFVGNKLSSGELRTADGAHHDRPAQHPLADRGVRLVGRQHHAAAAGAELDSRPVRDRSTSSSRTSRSSSTACTRRSAISASSFRPRSPNRETSELVSALDLIDTLPPGLYEAVIEDTRPDMAISICRGPLPDPVRAAQDRGHPRARRRPPGRTGVSTSSSASPRSTRACTTRSCRRG